MRGYKLFSGSANPLFTAKVGEYLNTSVGEASLKRFLVQFYL